MLRAVPRQRSPLSARGAEVLRLIAEQGAPVFLTVQANGRRRYSYWQGVDSQERRGGCQVALPTEECDALHAEGRLVLGDPIVDRSRTMYPVRAAVSPVRSAGRESSDTPPPPRPVAVPDLPLVARHVLTA